MLSPKHPASHVLTAIVGLVLLPASVFASSPGPQASQWSSSGTRPVLMSKASDYFSTTQGNFVSKQAMVSARGPQNAQSRAVVEAKAGNLSEQFNHVLGGIPDPEVTLAGGEKLFGACEPHNCVGSKAFVVTDATGNAIEAAGFLGVLCGDARKARSPSDMAGANCDSTPTLTLFYPDRQARKPALSLEVIKWAREKAAADHQAKVRIEEKFVR